MVVRPPDLPSIRGLQSIGSCDGGAVPTRRITHDHRVGELSTENVDFVEIGEVVRRSKWLETGLERSEHDAHAEVGDDARGHARGLDEVSRVVVGAPLKIHDLVLAY